MIFRPDGSRVETNSGLISDEAFVAAYTIEGWYMCGIYYLYMKDKEVLCCGENWDGYYSKPLDQYFNTREEFVEMLKNSK